MIMHGLDFSATLIVRKPLFDRMAQSAKCCEQTLVLPGARSKLSRSTVLATDSSERLVFE
ncbi:hypothetical protein A3728_09345 [Sulfitobacter sp. HI0040]|nr:hypothetical protein A3728_09345 [Sulfitobacter sp. HI0040]